jgi:hypothetical protein
MTHRRLIEKLQADPGTWMLAGKGMSEGFVKSLEETGADVLTHRLKITRRGRPIFDVMARWPIPDPPKYPHASTWVRYPEGENE